MCRVATEGQRASALKAELVRVERQVNQFLDCIVEAETPAVRKAYEVRIGKLEAEKLELSEKIADCGKPLRSFDDSVRTALDLVENPLKIWHLESIAHKHAVLKLAFADKPAYVRNQGFRTANLALPFKALATFSGGKIDMARPERFELPTFWFVARRSIQLSYGRVKTVLAG